MVRQSKLFEQCDTGATFSPDRMYRYKLWRVWTKTSNPPRLCNFLMLNPSTADEDKNDATIERCERRARMWGYDGLAVTNLFSFRATDPKDMLAAPEPIGIENNLAIWDTRMISAITICAWGNDGAYCGRGADVLRDMATNDLFWKSRLHCLGVNSTAHPKHPLYLSYKLRPVIYKEAELVMKSVDKYK